MWSAPPLVQWTPCFSDTPSTPTIPNKFRLYSQLRNLDLNTDSTTDIGKFGKAVKSGYVMEQDKKKSRAKHKQQGAKEEEDEEKKLSGLDILRALERATAQKMKKKKKERNGSVIGSRQGRQERKEDEALEDYGNKNVRALNIKEDWGTRLDELETRLQELLDTTAAA